MEEGKRYMIDYLPGGARTPRRAVLDFLGVEGNEFKFSARPLFGTQTLHRTELLSWKEVPKDTKIFLNQMIASPGRFE